MTEKTKKSLIKNEFRHLRSILDIMAIDIKCKRVSYKNYDNYFHNLKKQYKRFIDNQYEQYKNIYCLARLRAYIDAGFDSGTITYNTWQILQCYVEKILDEV